MAELNFPTLKPEDMPQVDENVTGAGSTSPNTEIQPPKVNPTVPETPVAPETPTVTPPVIQPNVPETPVIEPVAPVIEPKVEEIKPVVTEAPKTATGKVETVQDIKTKEIQNETLTDEQIERKKTQAVSEMQNLILNGATTEQLAKLGANNPEFRDDLNVALKSSFKNVENTAYFGKYSTMGNDALYTAYKNGSVVPGSDQYNLLPAEQRARFEQFTKIKESVNIDKETDFTRSDNVTNMSQLESEVPKMFNSTVRENYEKALNSPRMQELNADLLVNQQDVNKIDSQIRSIKDTISDSGFGGTGIGSRLESQNLIKLQREKTELLLQRDIYLGEYQSIKSNAETELKLSQYEDGIAREEYNTQLSIYESKKQAAIERGQELEDREFTQKSQEQALQKQQSFTKEMKELDQKLKNENKTGTYQTDRDGNMLYVVNGVAQKVRDSDGEVVGVTQKKEYSESIQKNTDGTYSVFRTYEDGRKPEMFAYGIDGKAANNSVQGVYDALGNLDAKGGKWFDGQPGLLQCGEAANRYMKSVGITDLRVGDSYASKKDLINNNVPQVGGLAIWNPNAEGKYGENGHIGMVSGYNPEQGTVEITDWNKNGDGEKNTYTIPVSQVLNSDGGFGHLDAGEQDIAGDVDITDIATFNNSTFKPQNIDNKSTLDKYNSFLNKKEEVFSNKDVEISDILKYSRGGKNLTVSSSKSLEKFDSALNQLSSIQEQISGMDTGPVVGRLSGLNPYNTDAQVLKAQLTSLIPNLARGVYGEVGVLTDNDVRLYSQTIPNLTSTNDTNDAVLAMTLKVVAGGYKRQLQSLAASGQDVSGFEGLYQNLMGQVDSIETRLGINEDAVNTVNSYDAYKNYKNTPTGNTQVNQDNLDLYSNN